MGNIPVIPVQQVNGPVPTAWQPAPAASGWAATTPAWNPANNNPGILGQLGNSVGNIPQNFYSGVSGLGQNVSSLFPFFQAETMSEEDYRNWKDDATLDDYLPFRKYWEWRVRSDCQVDDWDRYGSFSNWWKQQKRHREQFRQDFQNWKRCWHALEVALWREARAWRRLKEQLKRRHANKFAADDDRVSYGYDASKYKSKAADSEAQSENDVSDSERVAPNSKMQRRYEQFHRDSDLQSYQQYFYAQKWRQHAGDNWRDEDGYWRWYRDHRMGKRALEDRYRRWRRNYHDRDDYDFWHWYDYNNNRRHLNWIVYEDNYAD